MRHILLSTALTLLLSVPLLPTAPVAAGAEPTKTGEPTPTSSSAQPMATSPRSLMHQGLPMHPGETIAEALPVWRRYAEQKPTLLLLSNAPALLPPPAALRTPIARKLSGATDAELRAAGVPRQPAPLFLPDMAVDLALRQGWLQGLAWAFPRKDLDQAVTLDTLRGQLVDNRLIDDQEAATMRLEGNVFTGTLRGRPFQAAALAQLPSPPGPLLVHIDLSYFQKLYKNEIATPAIPLVGAVLQQLKTMRLPVLAVTFSYSHSENGIPLDVRFLGEFAGEFIEHPERLDDALPLRWKLQQDILYLENFFQKDEIHRLVEQQAADTHEAAWSAFNQYHTARLFKAGEQALAHLARAVAIDRMYALEYVELAQSAYEAGQPRQALQMMQQAGAAFPEDVQVRLQTAELAIEIGDGRTARQLLAQLLRQDWSPTYYPELPAYLDQLMTRLDQGQKASPPRPAEAEAEAEAETAPQRRVLHHGGRP